MIDITALQRARTPLRGLPLLSATAVLAALVLATVWGGLAGPARAAITVPSQFFATNYIAGYPRITAMIFAPDSSMYATQFDGQVYCFRDRDGNGAADTVITYATGFVGPLGLAWRNGQIYVSSRGKVTRCTDTNGDRVADVQEAIITNIPWGRHWNTAVVFGPDDNLYLGLGSMKNLGVQPDTLPASIVRYTPNGAFIDTFARGFRNPYGLAFHAGGSLFATDNGPGPDSANSCLEPPDELNWVRQGQHYGFPDCFGIDGSCWPLCFPPNCGPTQCEFGNGCLPSMVAPILELEPHSSSDGLCFAAGFPGLTGDDLFIAQYGQSEVVEGCNSDTGHKVVQVRLVPVNGAWTAEPAQDFATGFQRPLAVVIGPDHALYVSDFQTGIITRIGLITGTGGTPEPPTVQDRPFDLVPNPATASSRILWRGLAPTESVALEVFDLTGRRVSHWRVPAGEGLAWNLRDDGGRRVPSGVYLIRVTTATWSGSRKLLVVD